MALLPLWVTGTITITALLFHPADWLALLTGITLGACVRDVWMAAKLSRFGGEMLVQDSPTEIGCDVYPAPAQTQG
jgi:hypothetical protein